MRPNPPVDAGTTAAQEAAFSAFLFTHNISVTFLVFAAGLTAGIGTGLVLISNGLLLGTVAGLAIEAGNGRAFIDFIVPHGLIELSCIIVSAAAGMRMGYALIDPGNRPRLTALKEEALASVEIVLGTMPWLVVAGISEAFVRGSGLPSVALLSIGIGIFGLYRGLVAWRGWLIPRREREFEATREPATGARVPTVALAPSR